MCAMLKQLIIALFIFCVGCQGPRASTQQGTSSGTLKFSAPTGWVEEKPGSSSRVAQYKLPKVTEDGEDASAILYYFGANQGGGTAANIERWISQMQQTDGSASKDKAKQEDLTLNGLKVTSVNVTGTYVAEMAPGSGTFHNNPNY